MKRRDIVILIEGILKEDKRRKIHLTISIGIVHKFYKFYNGIIINYDDKDSLSFVDDKLGYINILYSQLVNIEPFIEK